MSRLPSLKLTVVIIAASAATISCRKVTELTPATEAAPSATEVYVPLSSRPQYVPNEVLIKFKDGSSARGRESVLDLIEGKVEEYVLTPAMKSRGEEQGIYRIHTTLSVPEALGRLKGDDRIDYAEPNGLYYPQQQGPDPQYASNQWALSGSLNINPWCTGYSASIPLVSSINGQDTLFVGIIDEGVMYNHEDLLANCGNPREIDGDRRDNDGNGFVDDTYGWDFIAKDKTVFDGAADDHGTHVAGIIGAVTNNAKGIAGMSMTVPIRLISAKIMGTSGNTTLTTTSSATSLNLVSALDYFVKLSELGRKFVAINNSYSGMSFNESVRLAIKRVTDKGILFVAAVGNDNSYVDVNLTYPACYGNDSIIRVTATDQNGNLAPNASYGSRLVHLGAPGTMIRSTVPLSVKGKITSSYTDMSGTSQATALVTGAAVLYKRYNSPATIMQIKTALTTYASFNSNQTTNIKNGAILNIHKALSTPMPALRQQ